MVKAIPDGYHALCPFLVCRNAVEAIEFYKKVFGAVEIMRYPAPDPSKIMHAELRIGDAVLMLCDEFPEWKSFSPQTLGGAGCGIHHYVADVDALFHRAVIAGSDVKMPPSEMFWGDRFCKFTDPFGHVWSVATHREDLTAEEIAQRGRAFFSHQSQQQQQ